MRLIDAEKLKEKTFSYNFKNLIDDAPTVEAEPIRHGYWTPYEYGDYHWHKCSVCGVADKYIETVHRDGYPDKDVECIRHYCPNCGALMDEVGE